MIIAVHTLIYSDDPDRTRAFLRDVLGWPDVDAGGGWLIFKTGPSELGVHPTSGDGRSETSTGPHHEISLMCDDISTTMAELSARGAEFAGPVHDQDFGLTAMMNVPGAPDILLYQPRHPVAFSL
jgi:catechol 2,3-dioxygenase-like lactoylglutathione lyase family enzyme